MFHRNQHVHVIIPAMDAWQSDEEKETAGFQSCSKPIAPEFRPRTTMLQNGHAVASRYTDTE